MASRAERRRQQRQAPATKSTSNLQPSQPLIDVCVRFDTRVTVEDLLACVGSLPEERRTVTAYGPASATETLRSLSPAPPGWRRSVIDNDLSEARLLAAAGGNAPFIVFVDADTRLYPETPGLDVLLAHLAQSAGVATPLILQGGLVWAAGYVMPLDCRPRRRYNGWSPDHPRVMRTEFRLQAAPWTFLATRRDVWRKRLPRKEFHNLSYSDADYCTRVHHAGGPIVYDPAAVAVTAGLLQTPVTPEAIQLLYASAQPVYDEFLVL